MGNLINEIAGADGNSARGWSSFSGSDDFFIFHGCDGAGIQPDCAGDFWYAEHFIGPQYSEENCPGWGNEEDIHQSCTFRHPFTSGGPTSADGDVRTNFKEYFCGWWNFGGLEGKDWLAGPKEYNWYNNLDQSLVPFQNPYEGSPWAMVMTLSKWVCTKSSQADYSAFTGTPDEKCYCDNEPWNARDPSTSFAEPNWDTVLQYCGGMFKDDQGNWGAKCQRWNMAGKYINSEFWIYPCNDGDWGPGQACNLG